MRTKILAGIVAVVVVVGAIAGWQAWIRSAEVDALLAELNTRQRELEMVRTVAHDRDRTRQEIDENQGRIFSLRQLVPEILGVTQFLDQVSNRGKALGVTVAHAEPRLRRHDLFDAAEILFELTGDEDAMRSLADALAREQRIVTVEGLSLAGRHGRLTLSVYAADDPKSEPRFRPCDFRPSRVWFPGMSGGVRDLREQVASVCNEAEAAPSDVDLVNLLLITRGDSQYLGAIADRLQPAEIAAPPDDAQQAAPTAEAVAPTDETPG